MSVTMAQYEELQSLLSKKLKKYPTNKESEYNAGVLAAKSILKNFYEQESEHGKREKM